MRRLIRGSLLPLAALAWLAWPVPAVPATPVDLELVLAVDVFPSVDDFEAKQQRDGYLAAQVGITQPRWRLSLKRAAFLRAFS